MSYRGFLAKNASDITDPSPVEAEHIANLMRSNFPEDALRWVFRGTWIGPVNIPWDRIDKDDIEKWAASHQPKAVARFKRKILARNGQVKPSICIQGHDGDRCIVIDGHHRAIAHNELGRPVRAYVGHINGQKWIDQALETHSSQEHQGSSPQNKSVEMVLAVNERITLTAGELHALQTASKSPQTPVVSTVHHPLGTEGLWHTPDRHVSAAQQLPAYIQNTARALMRDQDMDESQAIATAVNAVKEWAAGRAFGGHVKVTDEVRQAAQQALREWEQLRASHHP